MTGHAAPAGPAGPTTLTTLSTLTELEAVAADWEALHARAGAGNPFLSHGWLTARSDPAGCAQLVMSRVVKLAHAMPRRTTT